MLPLSDFSVKFNPSIDYLRCILFIHVVSASLVLLSDFPIPIIGTLFSLLGLSFIQSRKNPIPQPNYLKLTCHKQYWILQCRDGEQHKYDTVKINFDGGFFLLLRLVNLKSIKTLIVFNDQLTPTQYQVLKVLSRI